MALVPKSFKAPKLLNNQQSFERISFNRLQLLCEKEKQSSLLPLTQSLFPRRHYVNTTNTITFPSSPLCQHHFSKLLLFHYITTTQTAIFHTNIFIHFLPLPPQSLHHTTPPPKSTTTLLSPSTSPKPPPQPRTRETFFETRPQESSLPLISTPTIPSLSPCSNSTPPSTPCASNSCPNSLLMLFLLLLSFLLHYCVCVIVLVDVAGVIDVIGMLE